MPRAATQKTNSPCPCAGTLFPQAAESGAGGHAQTKSKARVSDHGEVFTPPEIVNQMLDMLPQELFKNPDATFLDPACKTGVFLREIAKRLIKGLEPQFPDLQERVDHIFQKQLFGMAITELTSLLARRGVYCSKSADG